MDLFFGHLNDTSTSNRFTRFVLANKPFSTADFDKLHLELAKDPTAAGLLLTSETNRALFLSDFSGRVQRIITWLERFREAKVISQATFNKDIIHNFASHLVIPLLDSPYSEFFPICGFPDLVVSTIHLSYVYRSRSAGPKTHRILLERISKFPDLIRRILPSIDGAKVIQTVLEEAQSGAESRSFGTQTLAEWTNVAANLCQGCHADHFVKDELSRWSSLVGLLNALRKALKADSSRHSQGATSGSPPGVPLSLEDLRALALFNLQRPAGIGAVEVTIAQLQERKTFLLFQAFVKSFPCAACLRLNTVTANPSLKTRPNSLSFSALPNSFTSTLLGQKLGPWKVCLSERAFKDMLMSNKDGHLNAIASKLRELASGHWDPKSLRKPLSQKMLEEAQVKERVPLWRASYGSNGRILWQINVAFDEDYGTDCQIITVWRIGDSSEIRRSIRDILLLQKTYTTSDIHLRHVSLLEFPVLPEKYWGSVKQKSNGADLDETVLEAQKTLMSNKIYCITEKVLDRIFMAPESAHVEFPFDVSHEETEIIKQANRAAFILGRSGTGKTTCLLYKLLCRNIASRENGTTVRQIFLTRSTYLAQKLQDYLERLMAFQLGTFPTAKKTDERKVMQNDLREAKDPLEHLTLENIDDNKFPIVCTFDHLFNFLEKIIRLNDRKDFSALIGRRWEEVTIMRRVARMINYNVYRDQYWKKYVYDREKGFEPDLVFSEILGIIKGSTSSKRKFQPLSREEYLELSARRAPVFTDARSTVYDIYQSYERKKGSLGDRDDIDRVTYLLGSLEEDQNLKRSVQSLFDEVYVDEVQDNKLLEIDLLLTLVRNPRGIHFAGDTAQCISRDNTFRFQDVQTRFHEHFSAMANKARKDSWAKPELYKLAKNYRSHQGILSLAADIVQLLYNGFPSQIDILPREVGTYTGTKPTMFVGFDYTILKQPGTGTLETEASSVCFGADQVIIVRDDAAKQKLKKELKSPLILTIFESKGLEFDDVILYNFFSDSVWKSMGTSVLSLLLDKQAARYLDKKYAGLCTELKHLYVAATRARNNLWMVESDPESVQNIVKLWTRVEELKEPLISVVENSPTVVSQHVLRRQGLNINIYNRASKKLKTLLNLVEVRSYGLGKNVAKHYSIRVYTRMPYSFFGGRNTNRDKI
ncbi:P-loop containing nucleoside triphosphate hydrolase protein [Kalaharituber pfeilii]|nr:P-loop containing nucleoside triphosphate hydrolase protein [Kalaharituber pfeilii]